MTTFVKEDLAITEILMWIPNIHCTEPEVCKKHSLGIPTLKTCKSGLNFAKTITCSHIHQIRIEEILLPYVGNTDPWTIKYESVWKYYSLHHMSETHDVCTRIYICMVMYILCWTVLEKTTFGTVLSLHNLGSIYNFNDTNGQHWISLWTKVMMRFLRIFYWKIISYTQS